ncbi:complement decay-accelerating factor-like [Xenopus laevis]|uniref:Complement decay-accelerating factor-like n=1 Tax=Xenopus laevis TaxID=8355 RepID=A0A8J1M6F6_XENLA|nr:complement decay-accelerating factor-like [Xenopus laevis]
MELKHGTNYTVTLQGFTSAGPGEPAVWTHETPIADQCLLSQINGINRTGVEQEYYDPFESVTVRCMEGYSATRETISCLRNAMFTAWSNSVPCTEQCKKSDLSRDPNVQLVPPQDYYPPNTEVSVRCPLGYKPSRDTITCKSAQDKNVWDVTVPFRCVEQCAKPTGPGINSLSPNKDFYDLGESVTVTCAPGYQSVSDVIRCRKNKTHSYWNVPDPCIDQCLLSQINGINRTGVEQEYYDPEESVTVRCMEGYSAMRVTIKCMRNGASTSWDNRVPCTGKTDFTQYPSIINNNNTLKWRLSETHGVLTGYQLNMLVWKENTVIEEESHQFPPNVTEYRIPMEADTNYMVTVRGLTAAGPGEASVWISGNLKAAGASDSYFQVSLVLKPLFLIILILVVLCFTVKEKWEQNRTGEKRCRRETERGGRMEMVSL